MEATKLIRNIWAVGRNYSDHARELGNDVPSEPMIFLKAGSCAVFDEVFELPAHSEDVHHELEIALHFDDALEFDGAGLALDLTARDHQNRLKSAGHPWTLAKSFRQSCPLSKFVPLAGAVPRFEFELRINGELRQKGDTRDMVFDFERLRHFVIDRFPVEPGDLLLTGTPSGVSRVQKGDRLVAIAKSTLGHEIHSTWLASRRD